MRGGNGIAGIAWLGTVCGTKAYRTNINEYYGDLETAQVNGMELWINRKAIVDNTSLSFTDLGS